MGEGRQAKIDIYEKSKKTVYAYADNWQTRLNVLIHAVADVVSPDIAVQTVFDLPCVLTPEVQTGGRS